MAIEPKAFSGTLTENGTNEQDFQTISIPAGEVWYMDRAIVESTSYTGNATSYSITYAVATPTELDSANTTDYSQLTKGANIGTIDLTSIPAKTSASMGFYVYDDEEIRLTEEGDSASSSSAVIHWRIEGRRVI